MNLDNIKNRLSGVDRRILLAGISVAETALRGHEVKTRKKGSCFNFTMQYVDSEASLRSSYLKTPCDTGRIDVSCNRQRLRFEFHPDQRKETAPSLSIKEEHPLDMDQPVADRAVLLERLARWRAIATLDAGPKDWGHEVVTLGDAARIAGALVDAVMPDLVMPATTTVLLPSEYAAMAIRTSRDAEWIAFPDDETTRWFAGELKRVAKSRRVEGEWKSERKGRSTRMAYDLSEAVKVNPDKVDVVEAMRIMSRMPLRLAA
jgi:hypothetical protein